VGTAAFLLLIHIATKGRGMGLGDVKFAFPLGLWLGPLGTVIGLYGAFLTGAIVSIILMLLKLKKLKSKIAFGPFLILGSLISFFWGNPLISWYLKLFS
jgi:leader peptidase (prepilin peptidase)/N-methyltransferase